jgi:putative FmdB family regulatory protein
MPVYTLQCPDCDHRFKGMVMLHTEQPREWVCSQCGGKRAVPEPGTKPEPHPWERGRAHSCPCCG